MSLYGSVYDAPLKRNGKRRGVGMYANTGALSSGSVAFVTPFRTIISAVATIKSTDAGTTAPTAAVLSVYPVGNTVTVYGWMATNSSTTTLITATGTETVEIVVTGLY